MESLFLHISNILQAESSQISLFPEFWFLPLSICTAWSMTASQNRSTLWILMWSFVSSGTRIPSLPPSGCWFLRESAFLFLLCFFPLSESNGYLRYTAVGISGDFLLETCPTQMENSCYLWKCECQEPQSPQWRVQKCSNATAWGPKQGRISLQRLKLSSAIIFQCGIIRTSARNL